MKTIDFDIWEPNPEKPGTKRYVGQRTAQEVFAELRYLLESMGYLPDEYFLLDNEWKNEKIIPENAEFICTVNYGSSEGIYLDVCLKWHDEQRKESITKNFITGKTLGDTGGDLDRMYLIASAITKAFNGDRGTYTRYVQAEEIEKNTGMLLHLNQEEQRLLIDSLIEHRSKLREEFTDVEQLLRRVTGGIIEFVNAVGERPLKISDYDMAVLAISDGNLPVFQKEYPRVADKAGDLLLHAAGRPGEVGRKMTMFLLIEAKDLTAETYLKASIAAVDIGDIEKALLLYEQAEHCVTDLPKTYHGDVIAHAYVGRKRIANALLKQATSEQIGGARPWLLHTAALREDYATASELVKKGIHFNDVAIDVIRAFRHSPWEVPRLLEQGMEIYLQNYGALHECINIGSIEAAQILLERGMDFGHYTEWVKKNLQSHPIKNDEAFDSLYKQWKQGMENSSLGQKPEITLIGGL